MPRKQRPKTRRDLAAELAREGGRELLWLGSATLQAAGGEGAARGPRRFRVNAYNGGPIEPNKPDWLDAPCVIDLSGVRSPARISAVIDHSRESNGIFGQTERVQISQRAIDMDVLVTGNPAIDGSPAQIVMTHADGGFEWPVSLGADIRDIEYFAAGERVTVNGATFSGPLYIVRRARLFHIAFVSDGADYTAAARLAAQARRSRAAFNMDGQHMTEKDFHKWLIAQGMDPGALEDKQRTALQATHKRLLELEAAGASDDADAEDSAEDPPVSRKRKGKGAAAAGSLSGALEAQRAKNRRVYEINTIVAKAAEGQSDDVIDAIEAAGNRAIAENWEAVRLENELLKATSTRPVNAQPGRSSGEQIDAATLECAFARTAGLANIEKHYPQQTLEAAARRFRDGLQIGDLIERACRANGGDRDLKLRGAGMKRVLKAAFRDPDELQAAGASTISVSGILSNVANKAVVNHFMAVEQAWRIICAIRSVSDFKEIASYSLTGDLKYKKLAPGGRIEHGKLGEKSYGNRAETYARMLGLSRVDLINDDLGAFNNVMKLLGRGGATKFNEVFWTEWNDNSAFFTTGNKNLVAGGAGSAFGHDGLKKVVTLFNKLNDPDGNPMGTIPRVVAVPADLGTDAEIVLRSTATQPLQDSTNTGAAATSVGTFNPHAGKYLLCVSRYMGATTLGGSPTAYYLLADPNEVPVIEACFLNGAQTPTVESAEADFGTLGIDFRAFHDFGIRKQESLGGVKSPGQ